MILSDFECIRHYMQIDYRSVNSIYPGYSAKLQNFIKFQFRLRSLYSSWLLDCLLHWCWLSPARLFFVPSPTGLTTIFYSLTAPEAFRPFLSAWSQTWQRRETTNSERKRNREPLPRRGLSPRQSRAYTQRRSRLRRGLCAYTLVSLRRIPKILFYSHCIQSKDGSL
jgi:hypothetical protein